MYHLAVVKTNERRPNQTPSDRGRLEVITSDVYPRSAARRHLGGRAVAYARAC